MLVTLSLTILLYSRPCIAISVIELICFVEVTYNTCQSYMCCFVVVSNQLGHAEACGRLLQRIPQRNSNFNRAINYY